MKPVVRRWQRPCEWPNPGLRNPAAWTRKMSEAVNAVERVCNDALNSPAINLHRCYRCAGLAQLVEQRFCKP
jgi:hypothetical protein